MCWLRGQLRGNVLRHVQNELNRCKESVADRGAQIWADVGEMSNFLAVSQQDLWAILQRETLPDAEISGVVRRIVTETPRDAGLTHITSCCLAFCCFQNTISPHWGHSELANSKAHAHLQTMECNMDRWRGSALSIRCLMNELCR